MSAAAVKIESVVVEADGGSRGNPGPAGYGAVVMDPESGAVLAERKEAIGTETNNVAEYRGLIAGLQAAQELGATRVAVRMDSKLVVEQMKGTWQVKNPVLRALAHEASRLRSGFAEITFEWIPRERNTYADRLANEAMDAAAGIAAKPARPAAAAPVGGSWLPPSGPRTRLVLVRHGATEHSRARRLSGRNELPLDSSGQAQAAALAARDFGPIDAVISSPLRRARQTAEPIAAALGLPVEVHDNLAELDFGAFEGLTFAEAQAAHPEAFARWAGSTEIAPPHGESFTAFARRVRRARDAMVAAYPDATVLVVTHVTAIKMFVRSALDAPMTGIFRMHLDIASVSTVDYLADGSASLRLFNDTSHLGGSTQPMSW